MGGGYSHFKEAKFPAAKPPMFAMSLTGRAGSLKETMLLTYCPTDVLEVIRGSILEFWSCGIKKEEAINDSCYKFKLNDYAFEANFFEDVVSVKNMMAQVVANLGRIGWLPLVGCDTQAEDDVSTILFYQGGSPIFTSQTDEPVVLSISSLRQLILQNVPERSIGMRFDDVLKPIVDNKVQLEPQDTQYKNSEKLVSLEFEEWLWENWSEKKHQMIGRKVILEAIRFLEREGYRLATNFKVKKKTDCFFFERVGDPGSIPATENLLLCFLEKNEIAIVGDPLKSEKESGLTELIQRVILENWKGGIASRRTDDPDFDLIQIADDPWMSTFDSAESSMARLLVARIFEQMLERGYMAETAIDVGRDTNDLSSILFRRCYPVSNTNIVVISMGSGDRLRIINADRTIVETLIAAISSVWPIHRKLEYPNNFRLNMELILVSKINDELNVKAFQDGHFLTKATIMHLIEAMDGLNFKLLVCADINMKQTQDKNGQSIRDVDSFFFIPMRDYEKAIAGYVVAAARSYQPTQPVAAAPASTHAYQPTLPVAAAPLDAQPSTHSYRFTPPAYPGQQSVPIGTTPYLGAGGISVPPYPLTGSAPFPPVENTVSAPYPPIGVAGSAPYPPVNGVESAPYPPIGSTGAASYPPAGVMDSAPYPPIGAPPYHSHSPGSTEFSGSRPSAPPSYDEAEKM